MQHRLSQAIALLATNAQLAQLCLTRQPTFVHQAITALRVQPRSSLARLDTTMKELALKSFQIAKLVPRAPTVPRKPCQLFQRESSHTDLLPLYLSPIHRDLREVIVFPQGEPRATDGVLIQRNALEEKLDLSLAH